MAPLSDNTLEELEAVYSQLDIGVSPDKPITGPATLGVACNWWDNNKKGDLARTILARGEIVNGVIAGGIGRYSSPRARELHGEAHQFEERTPPMDREKLSFRTDTENTGDNVQRVVEGSEGRNLVFVEEGYLTRRLGASVREKARKQAHVIVSTGRSFEDYLKQFSNGNGVSASQIAGHHIAGEIDRLLNTTPYFQDAWKFEGLDGDFRERWENVLARMRKEGEYDELARLENSSKNGDIIWWMQNMAPRFEY